MVVKVLEGPIRPASQAGWFCHQWKWAFQLTAVWAGSSPCWAKWGTAGCGGTAWATGGGTRKRMERWCWKMARIPAEEQRAVISVMESSWHPDTSRTNSVCHIRQNQLNITNLRCGNIPATAQWASSSVATLLAFSTFWYGIFPCTSFYQPSP